MCATGRDPNPDDQRRADADERRSLDVYARRRAWADEIADGVRRADAMQRLDAALLLMAAGRW